MKKILITLLVLVAVFTTACKKATLTKKMNNSTWQLKQVENGTKDVTAIILSTEKVYSLRMKPVCKKWVCNKYSGAH